MLSKSTHQVQLLAVPAHVPDAAPVPRQYTLLEISSDHSLKCCPSHLLPSQHVVYDHSAPGAPGVDVSLASVGHGGEVTPGEHVSLLSDITGSPDQGLQHGVAGVGHHAAVSSHNSRALTRVLGGSLPPGEKKN